MCELWLVTGTTDASISLTGGRYRHYSTGFSCAVAPARHEHFVFQSFVIQSFGAPATVPLSLQFVAFLLVKGYSYEDTEDMHIVS